MITETDPRLLLDPPDWRVLFFLAASPFSSIVQVAAVAGKSRTSAGASLAKLSNLGLAEVHKDRATGGRPLHRYTVSASGQRLLPSPHHRVAASLMQLVGKVAGEEATASCVIRDLIGAPEGLSEGVDSVAGRMRQHGYHCDLVSLGVGLTKLEIPYCPLRTLAADHPALCDAELATLREAAGPGTFVERTEHLIGDATRCVYTLRARTGAAGVVAPVAIALSGSGRAASNG